MVALLAWRACIFINHKSTHTSFHSSSSNWEDEREENGRCVCVESRWSDADAHIHYSNIDVRSSAFPFRRKRVCAMNSPQMSRFVFECSSALFTCIFALLRLRRFDPSKERARERERIAYGAIIFHHHCDFYCLFFIFLHFKCCGSTSIESKIYSNFMWTGRFVSFRIAFDFDFASRFMLNAHKLFYFVEREREKKGQRFEWRKKLMGSTLRVHSSRSFGKCTFTYRASSLISVRAFCREVCVCCVQSMEFDDLTIDAIKQIPIFQTKESQFERFPHLPRHSIRMSIMKFTLHANHFHIICMKMYMNAMHTCFFSFICFHIDLIGIHSFLRANHEGLSTADPIDSERKENKYSIQTEEEHRPLSMERRRRKK